MVSKSCYIIRLSFLSSVFPVCLLCPVSSQKPRTTPSSVAKANTSTKQLNLQPKVRPNTQRNAFTKLLFPLNFLRCFFSTKVRSVATVAKGACPTAKIQNSHQWDGACPAIERHSQSTWFLVRFLPKSKHIKKSYDAVVGRVFAGRQNHWHHLTSVHVFIDL